MNYPLTLWRRFRMWLRPVHNIEVRSEQHYFVSSPSNPLGEMSPSCLKPGDKILTDKGWAEIQDVFTASTDDWPDVIE